MVKIPPNKISEELAQQDEDTYGTGHTDGDHERFADTEEMVKEVTGNDPDPEKDGFEIAEEVDDDEEALQNEKPEDPSDE